MKTKLFFACLAFCFARQTNAQTEFAPAGAEWHYTYTFGCCPEEHFNHIVSEKDTIVEETNCRVLRRYYDHSNVANETYIIKQEQGKVYYYYQDQFNLLFDFDAEVDDIVEFTFIYKKYDDDFPLGKDTILSARFEIEDITTNVQNLKTFRAKVLEEDAHYIYFFPHTYTYTEKMGLHSEFMPILDNAAHPDIEVFRWLRCYFEVGFSFISDEWSAMSLPCDYSKEAEIEFVSAIPGGCNDKAILRGNDQQDKDTVIISVIADTIHVFVGYNYICGAPFQAECEIKNDGILIYLIDTCEEPFSCYERCDCYYTFDFKLIRHGDKNYPYKIILSNPREDEPAALGEGFIAKSPYTNYPSRPKSSAENTSLQQNTPNPFSQTTVIRYTLPQTCTSAQIVITDTAGRVVRITPLSGFGETNSITIEGGSFSAGLYYYSLYVDDSLIDTKQMILTK